MFLVSAENGAGVNKKTNTTYMHAMMMITMLAATMMMMTILAMMRMMMMFTGMMVMTILVSIEYTIQSSIRDICLFVDTSTIFR